MHAKNKHLWQWPMPGHNVTLSYEVLRRQYHLMRILNQRYLYAGCNKQCGLLYPSNLVAHCSMRSHPCYRSKDIAFWITIKSMYCAGTRQNSKTIWCCWQGLQTKVQLKLKDDQQIQVNEEDFRAWSLLQVSFARPDSRQSCGRWCLIGSQNGVV